MRLFRTRPAKPKHTADILDLNQKLRGPGKVTHLDMRRALKANRARNWDPTEPAA